MKRADSNRTAPRKPAGFTLVEMLVVISIIVLLLSIAISSLKKARASARLMVCLNNMRQMAIVAVTYSALSDGVILPSARNGSQQLRYPGNTDPDLGGPPWYERLKDSKLLNYEEDRTGVLHCPSDRRNQSFCSYSANRNVMGFTDPRNDFEKTMWPVRRMSDLRGNLNNLILLGERGALEQEDWAKIDGPWSMGGASITMFGGYDGHDKAGFYLGRHGSAKLTGSGSNGKIVNAKVPFAMVDGHVEAFSGNIDCYILQDSSVSRTGFWLDRAIVPVSPGPPWPKLSDKKLLYD